MTTTAAASWIQMFEGVRRRRIALGERMYQMEVLLDAESHVPPHQHPHEQISYVMRGRLRFQLGDELYVAAAGESIAIPGGTIHAVWALEDSLAIDTFTPPREDYLAQD